MKLISCSYCGVVINTDRLVEPFTNNSDDSDDSNTLYINKVFVAAIHCPVCKNKISFETGDYN